MRTSKFGIAVLNCDALSSADVRRHDQRQSDLYRHSGQTEADRHVEGAELRQAAQPSDHNRDSGDRSEQYSGERRRLHLGGRGRRECPGAGGDLHSKGLPVHSARHRVAYRPRIAVVNADQTSHNIHPLAKVNREWNKSQPPGSPPIQEKFDQPEFISVKCNIHPWMHGWFAVLKTNHYLDQQG